ncbi:2-keto-4-pentenoate hydratase [Sulfolobus acidocaldarius SUSAZ]|nr:2-keto-4-pentenoate hydratase [Sulfolobus acidocaldarius SUSAZ]
MNKAELLFDAYKKRKEIEPFPLEKEEGYQVYRDFSKMLVDHEGLAGYKIALQGKALGVITKPMITFDEEIELWFKTHKLEVEIIAVVRKGKVEKTYLGLEIPATRFNTWNLPEQYIIADDAFAGRLFVGEQIEPPFGNFKLFINDKLVGEGGPAYNPSSVVRQDMEGYVSLGVFIGPHTIGKGDRVRVEGKKTISVKFV